MRVTPRVPTPSAANSETIASPVVSVPIFAMTSARIPSRAAATSAVAAAPPPWLSSIERMWVEPSSGG